MNAEVWPLFLDEASLGLQTLERDLSRMVDPDPMPGIHSAFRVMHNLKGAARMAGSLPIEQVAHRLEDLLAAGRREGRVPLSTVDRVREGMGLLAALLAWPDSDPGVDAFLRSFEPPPPTPPAPARPVSAPPPAPDPPAPPAPPAERDAPRPLLRLDPARLEPLVDATAELRVVTARFTAHQGALDDALAELERIRRTAGGPVRAELGRALHTLSAVARAHRGDTTRLGQAVVGWSAAIRRVRMLPLEGAVPRWRLVVAEAAHTLGKEARLAADVGDLELDRQILEALHDPVMHLLRNAVAHGIEHPDEREAAGKARTGTVTLRAVPVGAMVALEVADDGRGLDPVRIRGRAVELGLLAPAERAGPAELAELLFAPGFSTTREADEVSGRGVGLDVVRRRVSELGGLARVVVGVPTGAVFRLEVPSSLVSTRGLRVRSGAVACVLPASYVARTLRADPADVGSVDGGSVLSPGGRAPMRLRWLASVLGVPRAADPHRLLVVVLADGDSAPVGLVVDELLGEEEFVTGRLPWNVPPLRGVAGAAVSPDGRVALVLDAPALVAEARAGEARPDPPQVAGPAARRRILVVDDSLTSRTLEKSILTAAGYEVAVEVDGEAAWDVLTAGGAPFDLVVSDVQMPRLDGLGLTRRIRAHAATERVPVILVTSLESEADLAQGADAGADEYIVKGRFDQQTLLDAVARLI